MIFCIIARYLILALAMIPMAIANYYVDRILIAWGQHPGMNPAFCF